MIGPVDLSISIFYVVLIVSIGLITTYRKRKRSTSSVSGEYFLAGRNLRWPMIGLALFATAYLI